MIAQGHTSVASELGVETQNLYGESHLVHDALAGAVTIGEQFKVLDPVVVPISVFMMDGFVWQQVAPEMSLHDVSMFEHLLSPQGFRIADHHRDVSPFVAAGNIAVSKPLIKSGGLKQRLALSIAKLLFIVKSAAWSSAAWIDFSALKTCEVVFRIGVRLPTKVRARHRAVEGIAPPLFSQRRDNTGLHLKEVTALFAGKFRHLNTSGESSVLLFVSCLTRSFAEFSAAVFGFDGKQVAAIFARQLNRHGFIPSFDKMDFAMPGMFSQLGNHSTFGCNR